MLNDELAQAGSVALSSLDGQGKRDVHRLTCGGKEIILVGTAHISKESSVLVRHIIRTEKPDTVCVELCKSRFEAITQKEKWREMDIVKVIREKRAALLLSQLLLASFQNRMAQKFNIKAGDDMFFLIDGDIAVEEA